MSDPTWIEIKKVVGSRIDALRRSNDNKALGEIETAHIRGQIDAMRFVLKLGRPKEQPEQQDAP